MVRNAVLVREKAVSLVAALEFPGTSSLGWWLLLVPAGPALAHTISFF